MGGGGWENCTLSSTEIGENHTLAILAYRRFQAYERSTPPGRVGQFDLLVCIVSLVPLFCMFCSSKLPSQISNCRLISLFIAHQPPCFSWCWAREHSDNKTCAISPPRGQREMQLEKKKIHHFSSRISRNLRNLGTLRHGWSLGLGSIFCSAVGAEFWSLSAAENTRKGVKNR